MGRTKIAMVPGHESIQKEGQIVAAFIHDEGKDSECSGLLYQVSPKLFQGIGRVGDKSEGKMFSGYAKQAATQWKKWTGAKEEECLYVPLIAKSLGIMLDDSNTLKTDILYKRDKTERNSGNDETQPKKENEMSNEKKTTSNVNDKNSSTTQTNANQQEKCFTLLANNGDKTTPAAAFMDRSDAEDFKLTLETMAANGSIPGNPSYEIFETLLRH